MPYMKIFKNVLAFALVGFLLYKVGLADIWQQVSQITVPSIIYLMFISLVLVYISALKWKLFLEVYAEKVSIIKLFSLYLVGYFINLIIPSYVGGDAVRSWHIGKKVGQHQALAATVLERYTGIVAMLSMAFVFMWFIDVTMQIELLIAAMTLGCALASILILSPFFVAILEKLRLPEKIMRHFLRVRDALNLARTNIPLFSKALLLSYLFHTVAVVNVMAAAYAVGWTEVPVLSLFIVLPIILLIGSVPITPSGLGLQEGAYYFFLQSLGATSTEATAVALILRAKSYVLALIGGIIWLFIKKEKNVPPATTV